MTIITTIAAVAVPLAVALSLSALAVAADSHRDHRHQQQTDDNTSTDPAWKRQDDANKWRDCLDGAAWCAANQGSDQ